jgi:phage tail sheath gpL-like
MPISFSNIPANLRVPLYWVEVDPSKAGLPTINQPALLVGTMIDAEGDAVAEVPVAIGTQAQADARFGEGSELACMFQAFFANNFANEVWGLPHAEPVGGVAAHADIEVTHVATEAGTIHLYVAGEHIGINITPLDTVTTIGDAIAAAINEKTALPVTASNNAGTVTLTCNWKGASGNDIDLRLNYYGKLGGEVTPTDLAMTIASNLASGSGTPDPATAISNLGEKTFEYVAIPYTDSTTLNAWDYEYGFSDNGRWGWRRQLFGHCFSAKRDTYSNLVTFGPTRNSGTMSIMAVEPESPSPVYKWVAAYVAKAQRALTNDPARPLQTLSLESILPALLEDRFQLPEINTLAYYGLATQMTKDGGIAPIISRETTTYQLNLYGYGDDAYELVTTLATLAKLLRNQRHAITTKFPRHKLANDGTRFGPGQAIVTPGIIKSELVAQYRQDEYNGLVEDTRNFKRFLLVERDPNDPNRVNVLYPPDLINQLRIFAVLAQFRLQYDRGIDVEIIGQSGLTGITARGPGPGPGL